MGAPLRLNAGAMNRHKRDVRTSRTLESRPGSTDSEGEGTDSTPSRPRRRAKRRRTWSERLASRAVELPLERLTAGLMVASTAVAVLGIGGVHIETMCVIGVLAAALLGCAVLLGTDDGVLPLTGPAVLCWLLAGWSLVQLIPVPMGVLETIAPTNADIWARSTLPFGGQSPSFAPVSLDPGATTVEALRWLSYGAVFTGAVVMGARRGAVWGLGLILTIATVAGAVTLGHGLTGLRKVYGLYQPSVQIHPWHVGPLLNANNLAGLLNLGAFCGLGLVSTKSPPVSRWPLAFAIALVIALTITSASRGGVATLLLGFLAFAVVTQIIRRRRGGLSPAANRARLAVGLSFAAGALLAVLGMSRVGWAELLEKDLTKLEILAASEAALPDFVWVGMGRGSFETVFASYSPARGNFVFTHAENFVAQWILEWGLPVGVAALLAFAFWFRPKRLGVHRSLLAASAWVGVVVVAVQNLADLGFEVPGLMVPVAAVMGTLWGAQKPPGAIWRPASRKPAVSLNAAALGTVAIATVVGAAAWAGRHDIRTERAAIHTQLIAEPRPRSAAAAAGLRSRIIAAIHRHPADPYLPLAGAYLAWEQRAENPLPWVQRSLERSQSNGRAHMFLAQLLHAHGVLKQALLELRLAVEYEGVLMRHAAELATAWTQDPDELAEAVPRGGHEGRMWAALAEAAADRELGAACDRRALAASPKEPGPHERLALDLIASLSDDEGSCARDLETCQRQVDEHVRVLREVAPESSGAAVVQAHFRAARGEPEEAEAALAKRCEEVDDYVPCLKERAKIASKVDDAAPLQAAGKSLRAAACRDAASCASIMIWIGDLHVQRKELGAAVAAYERSVRDRETPEALDKLARAASEAGFSSRAIRALERLLRQRGGSDAAIEARLHRERKKVVGSVLK